MSFVVRRSLPTALRLRAAFAAPPTTAVLSSPLSPQLSARSPTSLHTSPPLLLLAPSNSPRPPAPPSPSPPPSPPVQLLLSVLPMSSLLSSVPLWLCCVAAYVGLSGLLLYFPSLLSPLYPRRREVAYSVRYGAHRGGGGERIENTIAAFEHAVACGCSLLELDVHLTKDGHVVVLHDSSLLRTTGQPLRVNDINFADLPRSLSSLAAPPPFSPPGTLTSHVVADGAPTAVLDDAYRIPLLSAVLKRFPHSVVNVDLKDDSDQLCDATIEVVEAANAHDRVIWGAPAATHTHAHPSSQTAMSSRSREHCHDGASSRCSLITRLLFWHCDCVGGWWLLVLLPLLLSVRVDALSAGRSNE